MARWPGPGRAGALCRRRQGDPALPAQQRPSGQTRRMAVEGGAAAALPDSGERLLGAGEAGPREGRGAWSYYSMTDGRPFFMAGLWSRSRPSHGRGRGHVHADHHRRERDHARARPHAGDPGDRCGPPVDRAWPLPAELLAPIPGRGDEGWRVGDAAKNSRIEPHAGMAEAVPG